MSHNLVDTLVDLIRNKRDRGEEDLPCEAPLTILITYSHMEFHMQP